MTYDPAAPGPDFEGFELEADMIHVLANAKRLMILNYLADSTRTVTEIANQLHLSLQNTSQHLRLMRDRSIVRAQRDGHEVRYTVTSPVFAEACRLVRQALLAEAQARSARYGGTEESEPHPTAFRVPHLSRPRVPMPVPG
ncbi:MAG TPA: metalloregulator ArsR/SmtB family transcription factor [Thermoplasmata archaeon]|jgi:ArsR family transcriptional regulator, virulence genes transcriptional regulator|nr:metalloregulator ArsR/SmtB family transcription factor [Thermoplasmata archaeon]